MPDPLEETGVLIVHGSGFGADPKPCYFHLVYLANEETVDTVFQEDQPLPQEPLRVATLAPLLSVSSSGRRGQLC